jgi:CBS domain-containing membrane protein
MKVKDVMRTSVIVLPQNATLKDVLDQFLKHHLDSLPIIDAAQRVVGFITIDDLVDIFLPRYYEILRDFSALEDKGQLAALFNQAFQGLDTHHEQLILAADVMNSDIHWISQEDSLVAAAAHLQVQNFERLPVVDKDQKLVGLISDFEVILALLRGAPSISASKRVSNPVSK